MDRIKETIHDYEFMTAGRFYTEAQRQSIFNLVARANMLCESEEAQLKALIFSEEMEEYKTETDCANGLLMASLLKNSGYEQEILSIRKQTLESLSSKRLFDSRESWLKFIHSPKHTFLNRFEKAIYFYSVQKTEKCVEILKEYAEYFHYLSVKLMVALGRQLNSVNNEARFLVIFNRILEELLYDEVPTEYVDRLHEIWAQVPEEQIECAYNLKLTYFSDDLECGERIGFN